LAYIDYAIVFAYILALAYLGYFRHSFKQSAANYVLAGRTLTLPAFVGSLVSTWYGGILGVGEFSYRFGVSNWLVFGLPYYIGAFIFALIFAERARRTENYTIPDNLDRSYGRPTAIAGSIILFLMTLPASYVLMLAILFKFLFGWPLWIGALIGTIISIIFILLGGFRSVVRTDNLQFILMFSGFIIMFIILVSQYGGLDFIKKSVPATHLTWRGTNTAWYIAVWYFLALETLVEPLFFQHCHSTRDARIARSGILISIIFWCIFDFLTTSCGIYARAILPNLADPASSYTELAAKILPTGLLGLFTLALLSSVHSTLDAYFFLAATTFSRDIVWRIFKVPEDKIPFFTRLGLIISAIIAFLGALYFKSIIAIWHDFGSIGTPALLVPLFFAYYGKRKMKAGAAFLSVILAGGISLFWLLSRYLTPDGNYWLGIEPIFPGLIISILLYIIGSEKSTILQGH